VSHESHDYGEEEVSTMLVDDSTLEGEGFTSSIPFEVHAESDCLVICCSDHRFQQQNIEFLRALGYRSPEVLQFPSGVSLAHSMVASVNFLSKAVEKLIDKAVELTGVDTVVCIAHEDCGGYKAGRVRLIGKLTQRMSGKSVEEIQHDHLVDAVSFLQRYLRKVRVRAFFADIVDGEGGPRVSYREVSPTGHKSNR